MKQHPRTAEFFLFHLLSRMTVRPFSSSLLRAIDESLELDTNTNHPHTHPPHFRNCPA